VLRGVEAWKRNRKPPITATQIAQAIALLGMRGWIDVELDGAFEALVQ
jgi:hypothetical protein